MPINNLLLDNGIRLLTEPIAATEAVAIGFWFPSGSRDEAPGEHGVTHFMEHLFFKGSPGLSAYDISRFFDRIGGYANAFTEREMLCVHCVVPRLYALDALDMLARMIYESAFDDADIEKERTVIESEIVSTFDDPEEMGLDFALSSMYANHGMTRPVAGSIQDVRALSPSTLRAYKKRYLSKNTPLVAVAGNIEDRPFAKKLSALRTDSDIEATRDDVDAVPVMRPGFYSKGSRFAQSQVYFAHDVSLARDEKKWLTVSILNAIVGDTVSSRLFQSLRERNGVCYFLGSFVVSNTDSAFWMASAAVPEGKTALAMKLLFDEMDLLEKNGITREEIRDAREHICGEMLLSSEDTEHRMKLLARQWFFGGSVLSVPETIRLVENISDDEVQNFSADIFRSDERAFALYASAREIREAKRKWKSDIR